jgi:MoxR-like ATPase
MLSELLAAAIGGTSQLVVQGTAGTHEEHLRYGWNYGLLLQQGPSRASLVASPILTAMLQGRVARVEELTRCLPEVQDALVSLLSDRRMAVPELGEAGTIHARPGFNLIATANLRDRGVSELSAALKRRFNFENVPPIARIEDEVALVRRQAEAALARVGQPLGVDEGVLRAVVTAFRDMRIGRTEEGWVVEKPQSVMSTAEAVAVAGSIAMHRACFGGDPVDQVPGHLLGVVRKDEPKDLGRLLAFWDGPVRRRGEAGDATWARLYALRTRLENA